MSGRARRFVVKGHVPVRLHRWGLRGGPWGRGVSTPLTRPPVFVGPPYSCWLEAVYDFPVVYHRPPGHPPPACPSDRVPDDPITAVSRSAPRSGLGTIVRGTPFALRALPVPTSPAHHRSLRSDLASRLPPCAHVWLGGFPGPRGLSMSAQRTLEGSISCSEWALDPGVTIPPQLGLVFSRSSAFNSPPAQDCFNLVSVEQLERAMVQNEHPHPDLHAHLVPDGLMSAEEYNDIVEGMRPCYRRLSSVEASAENTSMESTDTLSLQHDITDSSEAVLRALQATALALDAAEPRGSVPHRWASVLQELERAQESILSSALVTHWVRASMTGANARARNQFVPLARASTLALDYAINQLDKQLATVLEEGDEGDDDLAAVLVRELAYLKHARLYGRCFVGLTAAS